MGERPAMYRHCAENLRKLAELRCRELLNALSRLPADGQCGSLIREQGEEIERLGVAISMLERL